MTETDARAAYARLSNPRHRKFVDHYVGHLNASRAAREAGYADPREGYRLLQRKDVRAAADERLEAVAMSRAEISAKLARIARFDLGEFTKVGRSERIFYVPARRHEPVLEYARRRGEHVDDLDVHDLAGEFGADNIAQGADGELLFRVATVSQDVEVDWEAVQAAGAMGLLRRIKRHRDGSLEYEVKDDVRAMELLGKGLRMWTDRVEHAGDPNAPVEISITRTVVRP